jgi:hypothetical protein
VRIREDDKKCPECGGAIPLTYRTAEDDHHPFFVPLIGWTAVGKTVYLQALALVTEHLVSVWPGFVTIPHTDATRTILREIRQAYAAGELPKPTPLGFRETFILGMSHMARWGNRTLVLRDCAGEHFEGFEFKGFGEADIAFFSRSRTSLLMVSLPDLMHADGKAMDELFLSYVNTLGLGGRKMKQSRLKAIVIFSQADRISGLPPHLENYLRTDPFQALLDANVRLPPMTNLEMALYIERMRRASVSIREWVTYEFAQAERLVRLAEAMGIHLEFTIVSALGAGTGPQNELVQRLMPCRVLDPLFWSMEFHSTSKD